MTEQRQRPRATGGRLAVRIEGTFPSSGMERVKADRLALCSEGCGAEVYLVPHDLKSSGDYIHHPVDADEATLARPAYLREGWALGVSHYLTCRVRAEREEAQANARQKEAKRKKKKR